MRRFPGWRRRRNLITGGRHIFAVFTFVALSSLASAQPLPPAYSFEEIRAGSGAVVAMTEDASDGLITAGYGGVLRHDGLRFAQFNDESMRSLPGRATNAFCLLPWGDGEVWVGFGGPALDDVHPAGGGASATMGAYPGLAIWRAGTWHDVALAEELKGLQVWALARGADGVWIGGDRGLYLAPNANARPLTAQSLLADTHVSALLAGRNGEFWVGTNRGLTVGRKQQDGWRFESTNLLAPVTQLALRDDGTLLIATREGLFAQTPGGTPRAVGPFTGSVVRALMVAPDGAVWVGGPRGLWRWHQDVWTELHPAGPSGANAVTALYVDRDGTMWVAMRSAKIFLARPADHFVIDDSSGLPSRNVRAVLHEAGIGLWVSTTRGLALARDGRATPVALPGNASAGSLAADVDGRVWVALGSAGIARLPKPGSEGAPEIVELAQGGNTVSARTVLARQKHFFVLDEAGGVVVFDRVEEERLLQPPRFSQRHAPESFCGQPITQIAVATEGGFWLADDRGGIARLSSDLRPSCVSQPGPDTPPVGSVAALLEDSQTRVWAGMMGSRGLLLWNPPHRLQVSESDGLPCQSIQALAAPHADQLWIGCGAGITMLNAEEVSQLVAGRKFERPPLLSVHHGLPAAEVTTGFQPTVTVDLEGKLWFATMAGVFGVRPDVFEPRDRRKPVPRVAEALIDGTRHGFPSHIHATAPRTLDLQIELPGTPVFGVPTIRWQLIGRDVYKTLLPEDGVIRMGQLAPGAYALKLWIDWPVRGWARETEVILLHIDRPLFERPWVWAVGLLLCVLMGLAVHRQRLARVRRVQEELDDERARIARDLHDGLGQVFASLGYQIEALTRFSARNDAAGVKRVLASLAQAIEVGHERARKTIWTLRSRSRDEGDLVAAVRQAVSTATRDTHGGGPRIVFSLRDERPISQRSSWLLPMANSEIPAMVTEMLSNAIAHAQATNVNVALTLRTDALELEVKDDGKGISRSVAELIAMGRLGLLGIQERAARLGAQLELTTSQNMGTTWQLVLRREETPEGNA